MKLHIQNQSDVTIIENTFIDQYMPKANGEFVKLYLYLLRCAGSGLELSLSSIADVFDHTEKDVKRALAYWEKLNLLKLQYDNGGSLSDVAFVAGQPVPEESGHTVEDTRTADSKAAEITASPALPKPSLSRDRIKALKEQDEIRQLVFISEQYLARPLSSTEQTNLLYFYDTLHFSADLIEYLVEYCVSRGSTGSHYMEKVAQEWYRAGITTVAQAKENVTLYHKNYYTVMNAFGIKGRNPAEPEIEYMTRWFQEYNFTIDLVLEACSRTIRQTHQPSFSYADKILEQWHHAGIKQTDDIKKLDLIHLQQKKPAAKQTSRTASAPNRFNNFPQREYDWKQLEQQLLNTPTKKEG